MKERFINLAIIVLFVLFYFVYLLLSIKGIAEKSLTFDEVLYVALAYNYFKTGDIPATAASPIGLALIAFPFYVLSVNPPIMHNTFKSDSYQEQVLFCQELLFERENDFKRITFLSRLAVIILSGITGLIVGIMAIKFGKNKICGLAGCLLLIEPNWIAYNSLATLEGISNLSQLLLILSLIYYMNKPSVKNAMLCGFVSGLSMSCKITTIILLPLFFLLLFLLAINKKLSILKSIKNLIVILIILIFTIDVFYLDFLSWPLKVQKFNSNLFRRLSTIPILSSLPLPIADSFLKGVDLQIPMKSFWPVIVGGKIVNSPYPLFIPYLILVKTPIWEIILFVIAFFWRVKYWRKWDIDDWIIIIFIIYIFLMHNFVVRQLGLRYMMIFYALSYLFIGKLGKKLVEWGKNHKAKIFICLIAIVLAIFYVHFTLFPDYLACANSLIGGKQNAWKYIAASNLDWGQDLTGLKDFVSQNNIHQINLAYFGLADPKAYGINFKALPNLGIMPWYSKASKVPKEKLFQEGWYAISATMLYSPYLSEWREYYQRFRALKPVKNIGGSILIFKLDGN